MQNESLSAHPRLNQTTNWPVSRNRFSVAERGLTRIRENLHPGVTERELWAHLAFENAAQGGHWFEYAILVSGGRTNPWGRECSDKVIESGELVGVDTGMIGPHGYCADISRSFVCKPAKPTREQKRLYQCAMENLAFNIDLIRGRDGIFRIRAKILDCSRRISPTPLQLGRSWCGDGQ